MTNIREEIRAEIIQNIKDCGQALIDNAEAIAGNYKFLTDLSITCTVSEKDSTPYISVYTDFIPEKYVERW